jgi:hypothetical protein
MNYITRKKEKTQKLCNNCRPTCFGRDDGIRADRLKAETQTSRSLSGTLQEEEEF